MPELLDGDLETQIAFALHENKGVFALLLGSGLSHAAGIPTGWEITLDLIRRVAATRGISGNFAWDKWYREQTGEDPNYSRLLEELGLSRDERRSILHGYIEPTQADFEEGRKVPTKAHRAIADLVRLGYVKVIVTTNFDRLIESALRDGGIEPTVIASADALAGAEPVAHSACYVLKLHGDYKDSRILNTEAELQMYTPEYDRLLDRIFDEYGLVISGWSAQWDYALYAALLRAPNRRYSCYWTTRSKLNDKAEELANHRRARMVQVKDADSFFVALFERVQILEQSRRQHPESVALIVNSAKRYLSKAEYRIQLHDLVTEQTELLLERARVPELKNTNDGPSPENFAARITRFESTAEPLVRLIGVLGRWGDGTETRLVCDSIRALHDRLAVNPGGGLSIWLDIRNYPSVLAFTGYGLALIRAERYAALHQLFCATINSNPHRQPLRFVEALFVWYWEGGQNKYWKLLPNFEHRYTPLSDHLCELFSSWSSDFSRLTTDFELEFERLELLASLSFLEQYKEQDIDRELQRTPDAFVRMPVGRVVWDQPRRAQLTSEVKSTEMKERLLEAGFARGSERFFEFFFQNLERMTRLR